MIKLIKKTNAEMKKQEEATGKPCSLVCQTEFYLGDVWDISSSLLSSIISQEFSISSKDEMDELVNKLKELVSCWKMSPNNTDLSIRDFCNIGIHYKVVALDLGLGQRYYHEAMGIAKYDNYNKGVNAEVSRRDFKVALNALEKIYEKNNTKEI